MALVDPRNMCRRTIQQRESHTTLFNVAFYINNNRLRLYCIGVLLYKQWIRG